MKLPDAPFRWPTVDGGHVVVHMVRDDVVLGTRSDEDRADAWDATTGAPLVRSSEFARHLDLDLRPSADASPLPYTVVFLVDADRSVETFVQEVDAADRAEAFDLAVAKARANGGTSSGRSLRDHEWAAATEISVFAGHGLGR